MANLHVAIVVRTKTGGKRSWVVANGKDDPQGVFYLRRCEGSTPKYSRAGDTFGEAEVAKIRLERQLKAHAMGLVVPEEVPTETKKFRSLQDAVDAYIKQISKPDRNFETRPLKSIKGTRYEVESFVKFCGKPFI